MAIGFQGRTSRASAFASTLALVLAWPAPPAAAQEAAAEPAPQTTGFRLRGVAAEQSPGEDIFSDGGIEEANRPPERASFLPVPGPAPRLAEDAQSRAAPEPATAQVGVSVEENIPDPRDNLPAGPVEAGAPRPPADDPFAQQGLRLGSWQLYLKGEQAIGWSTNTARSAQGEPGAVSRSSGNLVLRSDWARHEASLEANASYDRPLDSGDDAIPAADVAAGLRLNLVDGFAANLRGVYRYTTESTTSDQLTGEVAERPGVHAYGASAEIGRTGMRLGASLRASADRTVYEEAALAGGGALEQDDRNNTLYRLTGRAGYSVSPALGPFVQAGIGRRIHDTRVDRNGEDRNSTLYDLRAGVAIDLGEKFSGEAAVGYLVEDYDGALETLATPSLNASLVWSPMRETEVRFSATTDLNGSTTAGDNGTAVHGFTLEAERRLSDRLSVQASAGVEIEHDGEFGEAERTWSAGAGMRYWINRFLGLNAAIDHERLESDDPLRAYDATTITFGVSVQR